MGKRTNTASWNGKQWRIAVQKDGQRRYFYSSTQGRAGQREANAKADAWLDSGVCAKGGRNSRCSGGMRRYREEHQWRRRPTGHQLTLRLESVGSKQD